MRKERRRKGLGGKIIKLLLILRLFYPLLSVCISWMKLTNNVE